ncbi:MAG: hypothetical protein K2N54_07060 [Helicobacter sp.]|nr:hypothetical protein [Helicobacter sp.]
MWLRTDYAHAPQRFVYVMPLGSNIDVARCGWENGIGEQMAELAKMEVRLQSHLL